MMDNKAKSVSEFKTPTLSFTRNKINNKRVEFIRYHRSGSLPVLTVAAMYPSFPCDVMEEIAERMIKSWNSHDALLGELKRFIKYHDRHALAPKLFAVGAAKVIAQVEEG